MTDTSSEELGHIQRRLYVRRSFDRLTSGPGKIRETFLTGCSPAQLLDYRFQIRYLFGFGPGLNPLSSFPHPS